MQMNVKGKRYHIYLNQEPRKALAFLVHDTVLYSHEARLSGQDSNPQYVDFSKDAAICRAIERLHINK